MLATNVYVAVPLGGASQVNNPCCAAGHTDVNVKSGNTIEVLPAAVGRLLVRLTVTVVPSFTTNVGAGTCIVGQFWLGKAALPTVAAKVAVPPTQPYPQA